jgi:hypothetical protein
MQKLNDSQIRQGDVLLVRTGDTGEVAPAAKPITLKEGEVTGHKHQFMAESRVSFLDAALAVGAPALLRHEEHSPAQVTPGLYDLPLQVEWTDDLEPRAVAD